jgi:hypothetical protein
MTKTALILDGRIEDDSIAERAMRIAETWLRGREWTVRSHVLRELEIAPCMGCFGCWIKTPGECVIADAGRDVARSIVQSDLLVYLTPIQFGGYSYELKKAVDRSIPTLSPLFYKVKGEVHHKKRYDRYPNLVAVGWSARPGDSEEEIFDTVVQRNAINMHARKAFSVVFRPGDQDAMERRIEWALEEGGGG